MKDYQIRKIHNRNMRIVDRCETALGTILKEGDSPEAWADLMTTTASEMRQLGHMSYQHLQQFKAWLPGVVADLNAPDPEEAPT